MPLIASRIASSKVNGPGDRAVLWFQGCHEMSCKSVCWNPQNHAFDTSKKESVDSIVSWITDNAKDGITFSGGEPMHQAYALETIVQNIHTIRPNLSIGMYTGYTKKELDDHRYITNFSNISIAAIDLQPALEHHPWQRIRHTLDFAIMGRFNPDKLDTSTSLRSSTNQELVLFSDRYKESDFESQAIEFKVKNGLVHITGFPVGMTELLEAREW